MHASTLLTVIVLSISCWTASRAHADTVAIVHGGDQTGPGLAAGDVRTKLLATGEFTEVALFNGQISVPTLATLTAYDSVFVFSDGPMADSALLGNRLADYVNAGGRTVIAVFSFWDNTYPEYGIHGRFQSQGYNPLTQAAQYSVSGLALGTYDAAHPIMTGVTTFNGGVSSFYHISALTSGSTLVASWSNGYPLVATKAMGTGSIVALNFYPPSNDYRSDYWLSTTDGVPLMANALRWGACGNGLVDLLEQCDDGNAIDTDGCRNSCIAATCGDGVTWTGQEECDDGNLDNTDACLSGCVAASCGDGFIQDGVELCDDGNLNDGDLCLSTCVSATCGDGVVQGDREECDDGANNSDTTPGACRTTCQVAHCGDGVVDDGEACDDGDGNGPAASCTLECQIPETPEDDGSDDGGSADLPDADGDGEGRDDDAGSDARARAPAGGVGCAATAHGGERWTWFAFFLGMWIFRRRGRDQARGVGRRA